MIRALIPMALLAASPAMAQDSSSAQLDMVGIEHYSESARDTDPWRRRSIDWTVDANGSATLFVVECPQCHLPRSRRSEFAITSEAYARIAALLPRDLVEAALAAPCTIPQAHIAWHHRMRLLRRSGNVEESREFFVECTSPELDDLNRRIAEASRIVLSQEPATENGRED